MVSLDRFAQGLKDAQEAPVLACCAGCGGEIYRGEMVCQLEGGELLHWEARCLELFFRPAMVTVEEALAK